MLEQAPPADVPAEQRPGTEPGPAHRVWIVFADQLTTRIFLACGIVDQLREAFPDRLTAVFLVHEKHVQPWREQLEGIDVIGLDELTPYVVPVTERASRRIDTVLDRRIGFYPLAIRHSQRHDFHRGRWAPGHTYPFLDSDRAGPLPRCRASSRS